jgi:UDP-glucose 4-epimerase
MKGLITGGAGFIGSHLAEALIAAGSDVTVVDDLSTGVLENLAALRSHARFRFVSGDVCDEEVMKPLVESCDVVFHLAAAVGVELIVKRPVQTISTNIHGTEVVLGLANTFRKKIVLTSSSEVYGKSTKMPFEEESDVVLGSTRFSRWSYACSKMIDEFLALAYHQEFGLPVFVCRLFNTIGPRQRGDYGMVVPRFVRKALRNEAIEIYGTGEQTRCFCHVGDTVNGLMKLPETAAAVGEVINLGNGEPVTIRELAERILRHANSKSDLRLVSYEEAYGRPFDDMLERVPDLSKARRLLGYKPAHSLDETLREIIRYERDRG